MASTNTLALGQANYDLLDALVTKSTNSDGSITETIRAKARGGQINGLGVIGSSSGGIGNLNIADRSTGLIINDLDTYNNTNINFLANAEAAKVALLGGAVQRFNASGDFKDSVLSSGQSNVSVRIGGDASGTDLLLGTETGTQTSSVTISRSQTDLDVTTGGGWR